MRNPAAQNLIKNAVRAAQLFVPAIMIAGIIIPA
jgi:hypothetical protein